MDRHALVGHGRWVPDRGAVVPRGGRLVVALAAGLLWLGAAWAVTILPGDVITARASRDSLYWLRVGFDLFAAFWLLVVAHLLSRIAHGGRRGAPTVVRAARVVTWVAFACVFLASAWVQANPHVCLGRCGPMF